MTSLLSIEAAEQPTLPTASVPVRVDYALTPLGQSLQAEVSQLKRWAEQHMPAVVEARRRYDGAVPAMSSLGMTAS